MCSSHPQHPVMLRTDVVRVDTETPEAGELFTESYDGTTERFRSTEFLLLASFLPEISDCTFNTFQTLPVYLSYWNIRGRFFENNVLKGFCLLIQWLCERVVFHFTSYNTWKVWMKIELCLLISSWYSFYLLCYVVKFAFKCGFSFFTLGLVLTLSRGFSWYFDFYEIVWYSYFLHLHYTVRTICLKLPFS